MSERPRLLVVDDEEAILETMTFTFEDDYEVLTSPSAKKALHLLDERGPVAVVLSDQRMPEMTGVEFLTEVFNRHPETVRIILTGFADMDAIIHAINDGHVYAYITKPWEPAQLKQVVLRAVQHYELERAARVRRRVDLVVVLEREGHRLEDGLLVVDDQDAGAGGDVAHHQPSFLPAFLLMAALASRSSICPRRRLRSASSRWLKRSLPGAAHGRCSAVSRIFLNLR